MAKARIASKVQTKIAMLLRGEQGTGKSSLALELAYLTRPDGKPFRVLYLDVEGGSVDDYLEKLEKDGINLDNIYIVYTVSLNEVEYYIKKATHDEPFYVLDEDGNETMDIILDADGEQFVADAIVVDSSSVLKISTQQGLVEFSKKRASVKATAGNLLADEKFVKVEGAGLELKDYNTINLRGQNLVLNLTASGKHYVITSREKDEKISVKDADNKVTSVATGKKINDSFAGIDYNVKTECHLFRDEDDPDVVKMFVKKDRTGVFKIGATVEDPSILVYQSIIDKTKNETDLRLKNDMQQVIKDEVDKNEREFLGVDLNSNKPKQPSEEKQEKHEQSLDELNATIFQLRKNMSPVNKNNAKNEIAESGYSIKPTSIDEANAVIVIMNKYM